MVDYHLLEGDFRKVGHEVTSGSVDLILTDAPNNWHESGAPSAPQQAISTELPASSGREAAVRARDRTIRAPSDYSGEVGVCSERPCLDDFDELRSRPAYD
jgi:hypothetical protein